MDLKDHLKRIRELNRKINPKNKDTESDETVDKLKDMFGMKE